MIRLGALLTILILLVTSVPTVSAAKNKEIQVIINNKAVVFEVPPIQENGRILVPVRAIMEELGGEVLYDRNTREIEITLGELAIKLAVDRREVGVNSIVEYLDVLPKMYNGRVMVPLRFIGEYLGYEILWNAEDRIATFQTQSETYELLNRIYLRQFGAPFVVDSSYPHNFMHFNPIFSKPFSFAGQMNLELADDDQFSESHGNRSGRFHNGTFTYLTTATLNNSNEISHVQREFVQDVRSGKAYLNQGAGWSRYSSKENYELYELSGSIQHLLSFLLSNHECVEVDSRRIEGMNKLVFTIPKSTFTGMNASPLNRILETHLTTATHLPINFDMVASAELIVDAESLRIESTDISFTMNGKLLSGTYTAHYDYSYEDIAPIENIVIANTGLELLNNAIDNEFQMNYSFSGELHPDSIQIEGSWFKDLQTYITILSNHEVMLEIYTNYQSGTRKLRYLNQDQWETGYGADDSFYYSGNKILIRDFLNENTAVPDVTSAIVDGQEKTILNFQIDASDWEDVSKLVHIFRNNYGTGTSWDATAKAQFKFIIDVKKNFIESMTHTLDLIDDKDSATYIHTYDFHADQLGKIPDMS